MIDLVTKLKLMESRWNAGITYGMFIENLKTTIKRPVRRDPKRFGDDEITGYHWVSMESLDYPEFYEELS